MIPSSKSEYFDVVIIGSGPAGTILATELAEHQEISVLLLERHQFPRYHVGESLTGLAGEYLQQMGLAAAMEEQGFPRKSGIKVVGPTSQYEFFIPVEPPSWQVRRDGFDKLLLDNAISKGVKHCFGSVKKIFRDGHKVIGLGYKNTNTATDLLEHVRCKIIADASGHSCILSKNRVAGPRRIDSLWQQITAFTRFQGAVRDQGEMGNNTLIFYSEPNHWAWFIPLSAEEVSVGVVVPAVSVKNYGETAEDFLKWGLANIHEDLERRVKDCRMTEPVRVINNYSYRVEPFVGENWLCIGDAHRSSDPVLGFGISNAMTEAKAASKAIVAAIKSGDCQQPFGEYADFCNRGQDTAANLARYFWNFLSMFGRQARGTLRKDIIHLLNGHLFEEQDLTVLTAMNKSLESMLPANIPEGQPRQLASRIQHSYTEGVEAAYLETEGDKLKLSFVFNNDAPDFQQAMSDFIETLYMDFGRDKLTIVRYLPGDKRPEFENAQPILRHRFSKQVAEK